MRSLSRMPNVCVIIFVLSAAMPVNAATSANEFVMCRNQKTVRTVRVVKQEAECATVYTKAGVDKEVGGGKNYQSCVKIMNNIRENLEKAGWKCREVDQASLSAPAASEVQ